jgi:hypothetical protein
MFNAACFPEEIDQIGGGLVVNLTANQARFEVTG